VEPKSRQTKTDGFHSEYFGLPMKIAPFLSGNFGELRNNHFHSGLDFKTEKKSGIPVYAVADGWISRIRISAYGFGYALYISHPNGFTSVYGHLDRFAASFDSIGVAHQYRIEQFELDTPYKKDRYPVKKGQLIAYSGNSGSSSAPHLHFEIRDTKTEETMDPLLWFSGSISDKKAPNIRGIYVYAMENEGILEGNLKKTSVQAIRTSDGNWKLKESLPVAWGKIGIGIKAYDLMDNTANIYGIRLLRLFLDDQEIYSQDFSRFSFDETRYINALIDYEAWQRSSSFVMKSFLEPGNKLSVCGKYPSRGYISISDEKDYNLRYELSDRAGNTTVIKFTMKGRQMPIRKVSGTGTLMEFWKPNHFNGRDIELSIPAGSLYDDFYFRFYQEPSAFFSDIYHLHDQYTPVHQNIKAKFKIIADTLSSKGAYFLAKRNRSGRFQNVGGRYEKGWILADIREFGSYTVMADTVPPKITPLNLENTVKNRLFRIRITDDASGIKSWRGTIDGKWILFKYDMKAACLKYVFDDSRLNMNINHILQLLVVDACGNESNFEYKFYY